MSEQIINDPRPPPPSWMDKDFIQTALRTGSNDPTITVLSCDFSLATAPGDGYMSNMYRAIAKIQGGKERRLVIKCEPQGGIQKELVEKVSSYERETKMFSETLPAMQKLLEKIGVYQPISAKCLYHGTEPIPYIVLEDLRWTGFTLANRTQGLDHDHCKLVIRTQALFHASSFALFEQDPNALEYYRQTIFKEDLRETFQPIISNSLKTFKETLLTWPGYERFAAKIESVQKTLYDQLMQASKYKEDRFNTLLHADTWTNNIMFKYDNSSVVDVRLVDFQDCYYASPTIDLQTFLTTCSQEEVRKDIDSLLKEYHATLTETLNKLQCKKNIITFDELKIDFVENSAFGLLSAITTLPFVMSEETKKLKIDDLLRPSEALTHSFQEVAEGGVYERIMKKLLIQYEELEVL